MKQRIFIPFCVLVLSLAAIPQFAGGQTNEGPTAIANDSVRVESLTLDRAEVVLPCQPGFRAATGQCNDVPVVHAAVKLAGRRASGAEIQTIVSGGRVISVENRGVTWDLSGVVAGTYTLTVTAVDGDISSEPKTVALTIRNCDQCRTGDSCPQITVSGPSEAVAPGQVMTFAANVSGGSADIRYNWTVSAGTIVSGQGTAAIEVRTEPDHAGGSLTATVQFSDPKVFMACYTTASETVQIRALYTPSADLLDEMRTAGSNCEEGLARMDAFEVRLAAEPQAAGVVVVYADERDPRSAARRKKQLMNYLRIRKYDASRVTFVNGPVIKDAKTQFWLVPPSAAMPQLLPGRPPEPEKPAPPPTKPYIFGVQTLDEIPGCSSNDYDVAAYAAELGANPKSRGLIVIRESSLSAYRTRLSEAVKELRENGVPRSRFSVQFKRVRPQRLLESTELWVIPARNGKK